MKSGLVLLHKEAGMTSQSAVTRLKRLFGAEKAGHTGTLDPLATGVLPVLIGRGVKASEFLLTGDKHYVATLRLGLTTDTEDVTGTVLTATDALPDETAVRDVIRSFVGEISQTPPMYSALKVGGKKLCDLARAGVEIEREARTVTVHSIGVERVSDSDYLLDVRCSKGTYIRTLCADIGKSLGVGGVMATLCRMEAAGFPLAMAHTLAEFEAMSDAERDAAVIPIEEIFAKLPAVTLPPFFARLARNGLPIYQKKIGTGYKPGERVTFYDANGFFALAEAVELPDGAALRPIRQFDV